MYAHVHDFMIACLNFFQGTDPDDVRVGLFKDTWLLSALAMLATGGGVGDDQVETQIAQLFVPTIGVDGRAYYDSECGVHALRLFKNGQWETIIIDDFFPVQRDDILSKAAVLPSKSPSRGAAAAHGDDFRETWMSLIEKGEALISLSPPLPLSPFSLCVWVCSLGR